MNTTRREFVKSSVAVSAMAALAARAAAAGPAAEGAPAPLAPYGSGAPIYLTDFSRCQPAAALSRRRRPKRWALMDYEADNARGVMLIAGENTGVPDVEYAIGQTGWFAIHFGLLSVENESRLQVRMKSEKVFSVMAANSQVEDQMLYDDIQWNKHAFSSHGIEEMFWRCAKLSGPSDPLVFGQLKAQVIPGDPNGIGNQFMPCWLAYIKLVPLSDQEAARLEADRARRDTRRLFATDDSFTPTSYLHFQTEDDIRRQIEPYRDSDFSRLYWEAAGGDLAFYPSKVGRLETFAWMLDPYQPYCRIMGQSYADFQARGIDPLRVALDHAHELGLEFHAAYRVAGFHFPPPDNEWNLGGMYDQHPEWRCVDRQGRKTPRMSYAFPEVREFVLSFFEEMARYPLEGVCLLYNRRLPVLEYEAPLADTFQARFGIDARSVDERDPRWLAHRAAVLTDFMRAMRGRMRAEERRQGRKPIGITAVVLGTKEENYFNGVDLDAWVGEGLIDTLIPYVDPLRPYMQGSNEALKKAKHRRGLAVSWEDPHQIDYFVRLTKGTPCVLAPNLMPRFLAPEDYWRIAHGLYQAGVENFYFWDTYMRCSFDPSWSALRRLGHRDEVMAWAESGRPPMARPRGEVRVLGDWNMAYQTPG